MGNNVIAFPRQDSTILKTANSSLEKTMDSIEEAHRDVLVAHLITESVSRKILVDMEMNDIDWEDETFLRYHAIVVDLLSAALYDLIGQKHPYILFLKTINESLEDQLEESE
jgi:hypothetical protein